MYDLKLNFLDGRLLYIDDKKSFIGYDPIFSEPIPYPTDNSWEIERAEHNVLLDGEAFHIKIKEKRRSSMAGFGLLGLEVFLDEKHLTSYLGFSSMPENRKFGSKWFYHNDSYYLLSGGWDLHNEKGESFISLDKIPMKEKYRSIDKTKLYLVKFKTFSGYKPNYENATIEEIITGLFFHYMTKIQTIRNQQNKC